MPPTSQFLLTMLFQAVLAIVIFKLYRRLGRNPWPPTFYSLVPVIGVLAFAIYQVRVLFHIIGRVEALEIARPK
jgi:hypothetical protein